MAKDNFVTIGIRLPSKTVEKIDNKVESAEWLSRSDFVRYALKEALKGDAN